MGATTAVPATTTIERMASSASGGSTAAVADSASSIVASADTLTSHVVQLDATMEVRSSVGS